MIPIGQFLLNRLHELGLKHIFGVPGDYVIRFNKMIEDHPIEFINTTREGTAGYMAAAYAELQGLGAACITYGVGLSILNGTAQAYVQGVPLVIISGAASRDEFHRNPLMHHLINTTVSEDRDLTQYELFKHVTIDQAILDDPCSAANEIDRVLSRCITDKKPVYIELPRDLVDTPIENRPFEYPLPKKVNPQALEEALAESLVLLQNAKNPVLWVGKEIGSYNLVKPILAFAEKWNIPIVSPQFGKSVIDERHPQYVGIYQGAISQEAVKTFVESADLRIVLGLLPSDLATGFSTANTHPKNQIFASNKQVAIHHHQFSSVPFTDFIKSFCNLSLNAPYQASYPKPQIPTRQVTHGKKITTAAVFDLLQNHLKPDHLLAVDIGDPFFGSSDLVLGPNSLLASSYFGSMGFAVPGAIGAKFAHPERKVIVLVGDGSFQMAATELSTAVRYGLDLVVILLNNHGYGTERPLIEGAFNDLVNWNYTKITDLLGSGHSSRITTEEAFEKALSHALQDNTGLTFIEVELEKNDYSLASQRFKKLARKTV